MTTPRVWLTVDNRLLADEFFRPSYTTGVWIKGELAKGLSYAAMLGNNLSQLGVDAGQLDNKLNTLSVVERRGELLRRNRVPILLAKTLVSRRGALISVD